jgi:protein gp37
MGESSIGWLHPPPRSRPGPYGSGLPGYTVNFWIGCSKVDAGCKNCYAEKRAGRLLLTTFRDASRAGLPIWGEHAPRHILAARALATLRRDLARWNAEAEADLDPRLVFGGSQMDWLEDRRDLDEPRRALIAAIEATPWLRWIMLTKRPENFARLIPEWAAKGCPDNVWFGISASDQQTLDDKLEAFRAVPARFKVISGEPLIAAVDWRAALRIPGMIWLILGGESGARDKVRPCLIEAIRLGVEQARDAGRACFVKQLGAVTFGSSGCIGCEDLPAGAHCPICRDTIELRMVKRRPPMSTGRDGDTRPGDGTLYRRVLHLSHPKGEDPREWPAGVQVQEWPTGAAYTWGVIEATGPALAIAGPL